MACNPDFVQYVIDQCSDAGEIAVKKMMGDYCVYCDGSLFGLICDNNIYVAVQLGLDNLCDDFNRLFGFL